MITALKRFLKHLFGREKAEKDRIETPSRRLIRTCCPEEWKKLHPAEMPEEQIQRKIDETETKQRIAETDRQLERLSKIDPAEVSRSIVKAIKTQTIREANIKRQQSTLGYGLKSKNFRPRPAFEKKTFDLRKKPEKN